MTKYRLDTKPPKWASDDYPRYRYYIIVRRDSEPHETLEFMFWASVMDYQTEQQERRKVLPSDYDILSCLSSDAGYVDMTAQDVLEDFGVMPIAQAQAVADHALKIRKFFTDKELSDLSEIQ